MNISLLSLWFRSQVCFLSTCISPQDCVCTPARMRPEFFVTSSHDFIPWEQFATLTLSPLQYFGTLNSLAQPNLCDFVKFLETITA